jgi:hypothetical protein
VQLGLGHLPQNIINELIPGFDRRINMAHIPASEKLLSFSYAPLVKRDAFRLLLLEPAHDLSSPIKCTLQRYMLSKYIYDLIDQYTALPYVWGDPNDNDIAIVDYCPVQITSNLASTLRQLRDPDQVLRIWADALCINQDDVLERNHQVQLMGSIYSTSGECDSSITSFTVGLVAQILMSLFTILNRLFVAMVKNTAKALDTMPAT